MLLKNYKIETPMWLKEMFDTGRLSRNFNPKINILPIKNKKYQNEPSVAIFFDGPLFPTTEGASNRVYNLAKYLSLNGVNIKFFKCFRECDSIEMFKKESIKTGINFFLIHPNIYYTKFNLIEKILKKEKIRFLQLKDMELVSTVGKYFREKHNIKICFDAHDAPHILLERLNYKKDVRDSTKLKELECNKISDIHLCVSKIDKNNLIEIGCDRDKIKIIPNGVDTMEIRYNGSNFNSKTVLFLGHMYYFPNTYAVNLICKKIIPGVLKLDKDIKFLFVGACPNKLINKYKEKNIKFSGAVENLNKYFEKSTIAISPLFHASGTRIKILHYFSAGLPVISTSIGAEGLEVRKNKNIIIENSISKYPELIISLLGDKNRCKVIGKNARKLVEKKYEWEKIARNLKNVYLSTLNKGI